MSEREKGGHFFEIEEGTPNGRRAQIKKEAIDRLISNVDATQVIDYL